MLALLTALPFLVGNAEITAGPIPARFPLAAQPAQEEADARTEFSKAREEGEFAAAEAAARSWCRELAAEVAGPASERLLAQVALAWSIAHLKKGSTEALESANAAAATAAELGTSVPDLACELFFETWYALDAFAECEIWAEELAQRPRDRQPWDPAYPFAILGYAHWSREEELAADRCYRRADGLLAEESDPEFVAWVRLEYANTRMELGDYLTALALCERVEQDPQLSQEGELAVQVRMRHGALLADLGRFSEAEELLVRAAAVARGLDRPELAARVAVLGVNHAQRGGDFDAVRGWLRTLEGADPAAWDAWTLKTIRAAESRMALQAGDPERAAACADLAIAAVGADDPREWLLLPWLARARLDLMRGEFARVEGALREAGALLDTPQVHARGSARVHLRSRYSDWLQLAADLGWAQVQAAEAEARAAAVAHAWAEIDRWKARTLAESLPEGDESIAALETGVVLLDYVAGESELYLFRRHGIEDSLFALGARAPLEALLEQYHLTLSDPTASTPLVELAACGHALHQALLAGRIPAGAVHALVVPEAAWPGVPFAALVTEEPPADTQLQSFAQLRFAIEELAFTQAPSRAVGMRLYAAHVPGANGALVFADPQCADARWMPLPGTRSEARAVHQALGGTLLLGTDATKQALLAQIADARVVHLATHAIADPVAPERSRIACSGAGEASDLTLGELREHRLSATVVVLSACETAGGRALRGEGTQSLAAGFLHAGAQSVIATLWPVFDEDAAILMKHFYAVGGGADARPADALRAAQLELLHGAPQVVASAPAAGPARGRLEGGRPLIPARGQSAPLDGHPMRWASFLLIGPFTPTR